MCWWAIPASLKGLLEGQTNKRTGKPCQVHPGKREMGALFSGLESEAGWAHGRG